METQTAVIAGVLNGNLFLCSQALCDQLPYFKALSAGALILEGVFADRLAPFHLTPTNEFRMRVAPFQHLLTESNKMGESGIGVQISCKILIIKSIDFVPAGLKVVLDICDVNVTGNADESSNHSTSVHLKHISLVFVVYLHYRLVHSFPSMQILSNRMLSSSGWSMA